MGTKQIRCPHRLRAEQERKNEMGLGKSRKYAAVLLTAAILSADVCGAGSTVYGAQPETQTQTDQQTLKDSEPENTQNPAEAKQDKTKVQPEEKPAEAESEQPEDKPEQTEPEQPEEKPAEAESEQPAEKPEQTEPADTGKDAAEEAVQEKRLQSELDELSETPAAEAENPEEEANIQAEQAFAELLKEYEMYGTLTNDVTFPIYQEPSLESAVIQELSSGWQVRLTGVKIQADGVWYQIAFAVYDQEYSGYTPGEYVITQDDRMTEWEEKYLNGGMEARTFARGSARGSTQLSAFPASYQSAIQKLIQAHPNWTFVPMNTGLEWAEVLENEMRDSVNLVETYQPDTWKSTAPKDYDMSTGKWIIKNGTNWVQASESIIKHYLDPRNFLTEDSVFQFEQLTYSSYHTESGVEKILSGTFMSNKKLEDGSGGGITYAKAFIEIGKELKVSPYFLASRVRQEQGVKGDSSLISGTYPGYQGYYNYFNMGATGIGIDVITSGLTEAKNAGWDTRYKALKGGAEKVSSKYIARGQDTFYLQKFDVDASYDGLYWHQYMQNLLAADSEGRAVRKGYAEMGALNNKFVFKVPVYNNMPASPCPKPEADLSKPVLKAEKSGYGLVKLSWNEVAAAQGYQIYRSEGSGAYKKIKTISNAGTRSYEDRSVVPGKVYNYKVRAYLKFSEGNKYSPYSEVKTVNLTIPATEWSKFKIKNYRTIEMSWKKKSVDGYKIYRKTGSGKYTCIATITGTSFKNTTVKPANTYMYRVRGYVSVNGKLYYSAYTPVKQAVLKMAKPQLKKVKVSGGKKVKVTWKRDSKADGYYIYRATSKKGKYKKVKTITKNKTVSWSDTGITTGKTYYYKIRSYVKTSSGTKSSGYSSVLNVKTALKTPAVTSITASSKGRVKLKWSKDGNAAGYKIYRASSKNGKYKEVKKITKNTTLTWTDKTTRAGKKYYYKIRAYSINQSKVKYSAYSAKKGIRVSE